MASVDNLPVPAVVRGEEPGWRIELERASNADGVAVWRVRATVEEPLPPPRFSLSLEAPNAGIHHLWHSGSQFFQPMSQPFRMTPRWAGEFTSAFNVYLPLYAFLGSDDGNRLTLAVSEAREKVVFRGGTDDGRRIVASFSFGEDGGAPRTSYEVLLRIDARTSPWHQTVADASRWMQSAASLASLPAPETAFDAVYSTWYAHAQAVSAATIEAECAAAAKAGLKTVIVDDGWQTARPCGYANAGDWEPAADKFSDMAGHVARVHALGLKYLLWIALPYMGEKARNFAAFQDKMLVRAPKYGVLDPRFPEVRAYLVGVCTRALREWGVDGLKLDYIDAIAIYGDGDPAERDGLNGRDTLSLAEGTERLLAEIVVALRRIKADALIEFRQRYTGPAVRQYGNLVRVADCPADATANRCSIAAMRLTCPGSAIHSDMLVWDTRATPEDAALQILGALFGVVQYSPRFADLPEGHRRMLAHWANFAVRHREALLKGAFRPHHPEHNYPVIDGETGRERVSAIYAPGTVADGGDGTKNVILVNATPVAGLVVEARRDLVAEVFDTFGEKVATASLRAGFSSIAVPPSGYVILRRAVPPLVFRNGEARLELSPACGTVLSLRGADGVERVVPADEAFTLQLLDGAGIPTRIRSSECAFNVRDDGTLVWGHPLGFEVKMKVRPESGGGFAFTPEVRDLPDGMLLEWFDGPQLHIANDRLLYWPFYDGCEVSDLANREGSAWSDYRPLGWTPRRKAWGALYPGHAQMQFLAAYRDGAGLYFAADDRRHIPKAVEYDWMTPDATRLSLQTFCGDLASDGALRPALSYILRPYRGGWMEACAMYRDWVRTLPGFDRPPARPAWMRDAPVALIYPVQGEGLDHGPMAPNGYFPFANVLPHVARYAARFDSRILALLMQWEGTAPWAPPYLWPPLGGEEGLAALRDALHRAGHLLGLYGSGTAWTQCSMINGYSQEARCAAEGLERHMMRGPRGEIDATICNDPEAQRLGYDLCLADPWSQETVADEVAKVARFGVDYCQFFDQNIGGGTLLCYARDHDHPPIPGAWLTDAMLALQRRLLDETARAGSAMLLGCEASAATPYARNLFFNDSREGSGAAFGRPVPGVPFVFHEWMCNFSGNQIGHTCDPFYRWTRAFHYGDMMALILGRDGHLATAWGIPWDEATVADEEALVQLVRDFCALRRRHPGFLLEGRMTFPFVACSSPVARIEEAGRTHETSEVLTSFWEDASGRQIGFATNWRNHETPLELFWTDGVRETRLLAPRETIVLTPRLSPLQ